MAPYGKRHEKGFFLILAILFIVCIVFRLAHFSILFTDYEKSNSSLSHLQILYFEIFHNIVHHFKYLFNL
jgi:phosphatidylserine synthase